MKVIKLLALACLVSVFSLVKPCDTKQHTVPCMKQQVVSKYQLTGRESRELDTCMNQYKAFFCWQKDYFTDHARWNDLLNNPMILSSNFVWGEACENLLKKNTRPV